MKRSSKLSTGTLESLAKARDEPLGLRRLLAVRRRASSAASRRRRARPRARGRARRGARGRRRSRPARRRRPGAQPCPSDPRPPRRSARSRNRERGPSRPSVPRPARSSDLVASASPSGFLPPASARFGRPPPPPPIFFAASLTIADGVGALLDQRLVEVHDEVRAAVVDRAEQHGVACFDWRSWSESSRSSGPFSDLHLGGHDPVRLVDARSTSARRLAAFGLLRACLRERLSLVAQLLRLVRLPVEVRVGLRRRSAPRSAALPSRPSSRRAITNGPISAVQRTCVPPQSSREKPGISTTRTSSPYFSPKSIIAPSFLASSIGVTNVVHRAGSRRPSR